MNGKILAAAEVIPVFLVLTICLFGGRWFSPFGSTTTPIFQTTTVAIKDPLIQLMCVLGMTGYFILFALLLRGFTAIVFWRISNPQLWLVGMVLIGIGDYAINCFMTSQSTQALTFVFGTTLGSGLGLWILRLKHCRSKEQGIIVIFVLLILMLAVASIWHPESILVFHYRDRERWSGPWDNPNIFGLLMGTGVLLAFGLGIRGWKMADGRSKMADRNWKPGIGRYAVVGLSLVSAGLMGRGLMHSYSRGSWLATLCGLACLVGSWFWRLSSGEGDELQVSKMKGGKRKAKIVCISRFKNYWLPAGVILFSVFVLSFSHFRQTEWYPVHRALSAGNQNDFSWRNRVAAWEGALQITAEYPWFGAGWNQPEPLYEHYYLPPRFTESAAIKMNDYFLLGATLGIPALFCFGMYLWLSLGDRSREMGDRRQQVAGRGQKPEIGRQDLNFKLRTPNCGLLSMTCHAGAIVLLVGFWFDGGLFKLATASTFWILLELGNRETHKSHEMKQGG